MLLWSVEEVNIKDENGNTISRAHHIKNIYNFNMINNNIIVINQYNITILGG